MRRFDNYVSALAILSRAGEQDLENEFIKSGVVDKFSLQFELAWKLLKGLLRYEGVAEATTGSPREILKAAYRYFDFIDEQTWLDMLHDRNAIARVYDAAALESLLKRVLDEYIPAFESLEKSVSGKYGNVIATLD